MKSAKQFKNEGGESIENTWLWRDIENIQRECFLHQKSTLRYHVKPYVTLKGGNLLDSKLLYKFDNPTGGNNRIESSFTLSKFIAILRDDYGFVVKLDNEDCIKINWLGTQKSKPNSTQTDEQIERMNAIVKYLDTGDSSYLNIPFKGSESNPKAQQIRDILKEKHNKRKEAKRVAHNEVGDGMTYKELLKELRGDTKFFEKIESLFPGFTQELKERVHYTNQVIGKLETDNGHYIKEADKQEDGFLTFKEMRTSDDAIDKLFGPSGDTVEFKVGASDLNPKEAKEYVKSFEEEKTGKDKFAVDSDDGGGVIDLSKLKEGEFMEKMEEFMDSVRSGEAKFHTVDTNPTSGYVEVVGEMKDSQKYNKIAHYEYHNLPPAKTVCKVSRVDSDGDLTIFYAYYDSDETDSIYAPTDYNDNCMLRLGSEKLNGFNAKVWKKLNKDSDGGYIHEGKEVYITKHDRWELVNGKVTHVSNC